MTEVTFKCDRCDTLIKGVHSQYGTAGFYIVSSGLWSIFTKPGEHMVCDKCIQSMPKYKELYGWGVSAP